MLLQCVAVCCSVLQCVAAWFEVDLMRCCSVLQCVAVWFEVDLMQDAFQCALRRIGATYKDVRREMSKATYYDVKRDL